jgi:predicted ATPase/DNA-binding winged helix-turn-helix (wHTH) protein
VADASAGMAPGRTLHLSSCTVDLAARVVSRGDETHTLTTLEARLLTYLVEQAPRIVSRDELLREVWGYRPGLDNRGVVDAMLWLLRRKVERAEGGPEHILTVRGRGYRFDGAGHGDDGASPTEQAIVALHVCDAERLRLEAPLAFAGALDAFEAVLAERADARISRLTDRSTLLSFDSADLALTVALELIDALQGGRWPELTGLRVRIAAHVGLLVRRGRSPRLGALVDGPAATEALAFARRAPLGGVWVSAVAWETLTRQPEARVRQGPGGDRFVTRRPGPDAAIAPLPGYADDFVGRADELDALTEAAATGAPITLVGPGGVGKTRLAAQWARGRAEVWFVDVHAARSLHELCDAVAEATGISLARDPDLDAAAAHIGRTMADRGSTLLVLDNLEQLPAEVAGLIDGWHAAAPAMQLLCTSRRRVGLRHETVISVEPLPIPAAIALIRARAEALDADDRALAALARTLDGLPLALELAGRRLRSRTLEEVVSALDRFRFRLLSRGAPSRSRARCGRHDALFTTLCWSWSLLAPDDQALLAALGTFASAFRVSDAEALFPDDDHPCDMADRIAGLVDHSLVVAQGGRFVLLESIRAFARHQLQQRPDAEHLWLAHADRFVGGLDPDRMRPGRESVARARDPHLPDLIEVVERFAATSPDRAARAAFLLWRTWSRCLPARERIAVHQAWAALPAPEPIVAWLALALGDALQAAGRFEASRDTYERAAESERPLVRSHARVRLALLASEHADDRERARTHLLAALGAAREAGDGLLISQALMRLANLRTATDPDGAEAQLDEALRIAKQEGATMSEAAIQRSRATLLMSRGRAAEALTAATAAVASLQPGGDTSLALTVRVVHAGALLYAMDTDAAHAAIVAVIDDARAFELPMAQKEACYWLARIALVRGQAREALAWATEGAAIATPTRYERTLQGQALCMLGDLAAAQRAFRLARERPGGAGAVEIEVWGALLAAQAGDSVGASALIELVRQLAAADSPWIALATAGALAARAANAPRAEAPALLRQAQSALPDAPADAETAATDRYVREQIRSVDPDPKGTMGTMGRWR